MTHIILLNLKKLLQISTVPKQSKIQKKYWDEEKEKEYIEQSKEFYKKIQSLEEKSEKVEVDGIFIPKKLLSKKSNRTCPTCKAYSFKSKDDVYMNKYGCCYNCFIQYVDGREERWQSGWRPQGE